MQVLTLCWDPTHGEARVNLEGINKLHGIEKMDFLDDVIEILLQAREDHVPACFEDYKQKG